MLCTGEQQGIFAGFFRYSFTWSLEKSWYVPVFFCWTLVKKPISQQTLLCVVICVNENWVALLFQDSLVWPFGIVWNYFGLAFEVLGPCARARLAKVLSRLCLGARARTWSDQTTQRKACGSFSANTNDKRQKTRLLAFVPPHRYSNFQTFIFLTCLLGLQTG